MNRLLKLPLLTIGLYVVQGMMTQAVQAQGSCSVAYTTSNSWSTGGQHEVTLINNGTAKSSWELCWTFNANEVINNIWDATQTSTGKNVCTRNAAYNANLAPNAAVTFGFIHSGAPGAKPTNFTLNGVACGGAATSSTAASSAKTSSAASLTSSSRSSSLISSLASSKANSSIALSSSKPASSSVASSSSKAASSSSVPANAARWLLNSEKSKLNFVSVKNTSVAENFTFSQLQGTVSATGAAALTIPLASIITGIDTRNTRMQSLLFETAVLPSLHFTTQLDLAAIDALATGSISSHTFSGSLTLHGITKAITFDATILKQSATSISLSPRKPIVINSADFDLNAGIEALRAAAGAVNIAEKVPVYFSLFLTKDNPSNTPIISLAAAPIAPQNLMGSVSQATGLASLTWADASSNETGFLVRRKGADGRWVSLPKANANSVSYSDNLSAIPGSYDYKVISVLDSIPSAPTAALPLSYVTAGSSSSAMSSAVSSSSSAASSSAVLVGDVTRGEALWTNPTIGCLFCHAVNNDGTAGSSTSKIDPKNLRYTTVSGLAAYIELNMPRGNETACVGQCAADTAAYLLSLMPVNVPSSAAQSSLRSSSSSVALSSSRSSSSVATISSAAATSSTAALNGAQLYVSQGCAGCHGERGANPERLIVVERWTRTSLINKIDQSMPLNNPSACVGACATAIADYILTWKPVVSCNANEDVLPRRLRLLTNREYANTVNDLLGISTGTSIAASFEPDSTVKGFDNNAEASKINNGRMDAYWNAAEKLATTVSLSNLMSCANGTSLDQCATGFVPAFGKKAFRRPLASAEQTSYISLFKLGSSNEAGARLAIQAMLASPNFLYRSEIGSSTSGSSNLTPYETASLLSYTFIGSMPDATLLTEADNNRLTTATQLRTQAARLLGLAKAGEQLSHFGMQWLHVGDVANLQRDKTLYPQYSQAIGTAMKTELDNFLKEVFLKPGYQIDDLFNPGFSFLNDSLASYYGISGVSGSNFQKVTTGAQRGGVLHMGAITANLSSVKESHPIHRGLLVRRNLLCQDFAPPPPNIGEVEPLDPDKPTRQRFAAHTNNPNCQSCHQYIDNIGFGFENYDAVGRFRTVEGNSLPVDASGNISGLAVMTASDNYSFTDLRGLSGVLAGAGLEPTSRCVAKQYQRFATGMAEPNQCAVNASYSRWQSQSMDLRDMMLETVTSPNFLTRN